MTPLKITILGITGRMGQQLAHLITQAEDLTLVGGTTSLLNSQKGQSFHNIQITYNLIVACEPADLIIDFSTAPALSGHLKIALQMKKPILIGTTGLTHADYEALQEAALTIPVLHAPNTSIGVTLVSQMAEWIARKLNINYDIEIHEAHHREKIDAPSGTALELGKAVARGREIDFEETKSFAHPGKRPPGSIGFSWSRGGQVIGEHKIQFLGNEEVIEISHRGLDRQLYAKGALDAARWLIRKPAGFYTIRDKIDNDF